MSMNDVLPYKIAAPPVVGFHETGLLSLRYVWKFESDSLFFEFRQVSLIEFLDNVVFW